MNKKDEIIPIRLELCDGCKLKDISSFLITEMAECIGYYYKKGKYFEKYIYPDCYEKEDTLEIYGAIPDGPILLSDLEKGIKQTKEIKKEQEEEETR